jgi:adenosylcobinamide-phosphate synthase
MARAVVESTAENTVDAVIAPALWALGFGLPGVLAYRATNTLDAMVGYRSARHQRFGWASARADDVANWLPARVSAVLVTLLRPRSAARVAFAVRTQAPSHPSPNSGVVEAAFAAALNVRLGGENRYGDRIETRPTLGWGEGPCHSDITRAVRLSSEMRYVLAGLLAAPAVLRVAWRRGKSNGERWG